MKCFNINTRNIKEHYFNKKFCSARVVTFKHLWYAKRKMEKKEDGETITKSTSINCTTGSTLLWPLYYCKIFVSMTHAQRDGD